MRKGGAVAREMSSENQVRPCRGGPRSGKNTAGSEMTHGKQTVPPELPRIDSRSAGSSRDGVVILRGM